MKIPSRVKLGPHVWKIKRVKLIRSGPEEKKKDRTVNGTCSTSSHTITIKKPLPESEGAETFLHEIIHGLLDPIPLSPRLEEQVTQVLAYGLLQVIRDNRLRFDITS